jgi:Zn-finger protein
MHELAKKLIKERISTLVEEYDFNIRKETHPQECTFYLDGGKCHNIEDLNCLTCLCTEYDMNVKEGGCKIDSPYGKYIDTPDGKIFDCSDCNLPHKRENVIKLLESLFKEL